MIEVKEIIFFCTKGIDRFRFVEKAESGLRVATIEL